MSSNLLHAIHPAERAVSPAQSVPASDRHLDPVLLAGWKASAAVLLFAALLAGLLQYAGGDLWLADRIYRWQGGQWALRDTWFFSTVLHRGGHHLSVVAWLAVVAAWAASGRWKIVPAHWRRPLGYLAVTVLASTLLVGLIKRCSGVDCPWDLLRYGGTHAYLAPFSPASLGQPGACFPAGHASAGYAWVAAGFALAANPRRARLAWALAIAAGLVFGISQQIRGAHFLSHDIWTAALCWLVAARLFMLWRRRDPEASVGTPVRPGNARGGA